MDDAILKISEDPVVGGVREVAEEEAPEAKRCLNCGGNVEGMKFCPDCGQPTDTRRFTTKNITLVILSSFTRINKGFLYTCSSLLLRPAAVMREYIAGKRVRYMAPVQLFIVLLFVVVMLQSIFGVIHNDKTKVEATKFENSQPIKDSEANTPVIEGNNTEAEAEKKTFSLQEFRIFEDESAIGHRIANHTVNYIFNSRGTMLVLIILPVVPVLILVHRWAGQRKFNLAEYIIGTFYFLDFSLLVLIGLTIAGSIFNFGTNNRLVALVWGLIVLCMGVSTVYASLASTGKGPFIKTAYVSALIFLTLMAYLVLLILLAVFAQ
ncbi:MAG: DUF3667 domain-containing protein [Muribaculaceae bacterium]|nr:DUF3667 domain-containing protein [Muribaculaceae bacterium]